MTTAATKNLIRKIKALRAKTTAAGASEAEAASAAEMAQRLMAEHQIDEAGVTLADYEGCIVKLRGVHLDERECHPFVTAMRGVESISGTKCWLSDAGMYIVGDAVGREIAVYLFDLLRVTLDRGWREECERRQARAAKIAGNHVSSWKRPDVRKALREAGLAWDDRARRDFRTGMAYRMDVRMRVMPPARAVPPAAVERALAGKTVQSSASKQRVSVDASAIQAGLAAGAAAPISMGVGAEQHKYLGRN